MFEVKISIFYGYFIVLFTPLPNPQKLSTFNNFDSHSLKLKHFYYFKN